MKHSIKIILFLICFTSLNMLPAEATRNDLPALCYHQIEPKASGKFSLSAERFRAQLQYLKSRNFTSLNSDDLEQIFLFGKKVPENSVIITFDDGFKTVFDYALPIMKEFGFKGIVCVYPAFIGAGKAMTWNQLGILIKEGWSIESHSMTHSNLAAKSHQPVQETPFLLREIVKPKELIEKKLGNKVKFMVWPYGCYTTKAIETAKNAGYIGAITVDGGASYSGLSPYQIKRQVVYANDDMNKFLIRLGMRAIKIEQQSPAPGEVMDKLGTISCRLSDLADYSPENYVLNVKVTGKKTTFKFDPATRNLSATINSPLKPGNYFIDVYLRDKKTGITCQNGWLFTIRGGGIKSNY